MPHLFALPTATTARQFGLGGVSTCVEDVGFPNPAFAGMLEGQKSGIRVSNTDFDGGMEATAWQGWYATTIGEGEGVQVLGLTLDSQRGSVTLGPDQALPGSIHETDMALHYGRRLSERWLVGGGASPVLHTTFNLYNPTDGSVMVHTDSTATFGFRIGALYEWGENALAGFVYDRYTEDVAFRSPEMPQTALLDFTSTEWAVGVSAPLSERVLGAAEWMELKSESGEMQSKSEGLHLGVEVAATPQLDLRLGSNDGTLALGAGYEVSGWVVNYAYLDDWNEDATGAALGGSETHQLEVAHVW
ncbi:MAG: hypothetical protein ACP5KN_10740 [Armatimonadota bacterium]